MATKRLERGKLKKTELKMGKKPARSHASNEPRAPIVLSLKERAALGVGRKGRRTMLFLDLWRLDHMSNIAHCQSVPEYHPEADYTDPHTLNSGGGVIHFHKPSGLWRRIMVTSEGKVFVNESEDGIRWRPSPQPGVIPEGGKDAPHHVATVGRGIASSLYLDPVADDGFPFKFIYRQDNEQVYERAMKDKRHPWHRAADQVGRARPYMKEEMMLCSPDGLHWEMRRDYAWGQPQWHPEEPYFLFFNPFTKKHTMTCRPGWGDRRVCIQTTEDFKTWSGPRLEFQPDANDTDELPEYYAMPVVQYGHYFLGFIWHCHFSSAAQPTFGVRFEGPTDSLLTYSFDGVRFFRGKRKPFIPNNPPGQPGCGQLRPEGIVVNDKEIRIYSNSTRAIHGGEAHMPDALKPVNKVGLMHTLRKDGWTYLTTKGDWGYFTTKKLVFFDGQMTLNAMAPLGEIHYQLLDWKAREIIPGFSFEDCIPFKNADALAHPLQWKNHPSLDAVVGRGVRLQIRMRGARLYAFHADYHFMDAQDMWMLDDHLPIDTTWFDY